MNPELNSEAFLHAGLRITPVENDTLNQLIDLSEDVSHKVEMGECHLVRNGKIAYSEGANPCSIIVALVNEGDSITPVIIHALGSYEPDDEVKGLLSNAIAGFVGGGFENLYGYEDLLDTEKFLFLPPPLPNADFSVVVARKRVPNSTFGKGIYYSYNFDNIDLF